jgi:hypothetical protein
MLHNNNNNSNNRKKNIYNKNENKSKIDNDEKDQWYNILNELKDYMFDCKNLRQFTKHNIDFVSLNDAASNKTNLKGSVKNNKQSVISSPTIVNFESIYKPKKKDSLFWCFYIIKYGISKYEMEIGNQYFIIEKQEKIKYIELLRENKNKDLLKNHKIKPLTQLEDDLANQDRISIKTFFALCIVENINIILIDKRKLYESIIIDDPKIHIVHRNSETYEHHIQLDILPENINTYRELYYKMPSFDIGLKSISSYKLDELLELCKKFNISINSESNHDNKPIKRVTKKDIYELLVLNF